MHKRRRVLLLIASSSPYTCGCLRGIGAYVRIHRPWDVIHRDARNLTLSAIHELAALEPDGVIACLESIEAANELATWPMPVVDLSSAAPIREAAQVRADPRRVAAAIVEQFLQRGFRRFACCSSNPDGELAPGTGQSFTQQLNQSNFEVLRFQPSINAPDNGLAEWVKSLPRPIAVMAADDRLGRRILEACADAGIPVPEQISVVAVGDDDALCELASPSLSSVRLDAVATGTRAASLLGELLRFRSPARGESVLLPPVGVTTRESSGGPAVDDAVVAQALHLIRESACGGINVEELLNHLPVSRATLERRFARLLNCTPKDQILRLRIDRARQLLRETDYNLATIAKLCGFKTAAHLSVTFKAQTHQSPGQFRNGAPARDTV